MQPTTIPANETMTTCPAMPIWLALTSKAGLAGIVSGHQTEAIIPTVGIIESVPVADFRKRLCGPEGRALAYVIEPVEIRRERLGLSPFVPKDQFSMLGPYVKAFNACGPRTNGPVAIHYAPQRGLLDRSGRAPGGELTPQAPVAPQPGIQIEAWRPEPLRPIDPMPARPFALEYLAEADGSASIRRPKQALRELVLPSPRPWQSLTILWQSFGGFHLALPSAEGVAQPAIQSMASAELWNGTAEMNLLGRRFLQESQALPREHQPSLEGARAEMSEVFLVAFQTPLSAGFDEAFQGRRPSVDGQEIFTNTVPERLPLPQSVGAPVPAVALSTGLLVWTGIINSYMHRNFCAPRLREGGRAVHTLRLAPSMQVNEECEISAA